MAVIINDHTDEFKSKINKGYIKGLIKVGMQAEKNAKQNAPVDTSKLKNSITNIVDAGELEVIIGSNVEYAKYQEYGTGRNSDVGGNSEIGGIKPKRFLRRAATDHGSEYRELIVTEIANAISK